MNINSRVSFSLLLVSFGANFVVAQDGHGFILRYENQGEHGTFSCLGDASVKWRITEPDPVGTNPVTGQLPFDVARDGQHLVGTLILAAGVDSASGTGKACIGGGNGYASGARTVEFPASGVVNWGATIEPESIYWSIPESRLYVLDSRNKKIHYAPWSGVAESIPSASAFSLAADLSGIAASALPGDLHRPFNGYGIGVSLGEPGMGGAEYVVWHDGQAWNIEEIEIQPTVLPPKWCVYSPESCGPDFPLYVSGAVGPFQLVDHQSGLAVYSGSSASAESWTEIPSGLLVPGDYYRVVGARALDSVVLTPLKRFTGVSLGNPTPDGFSMSRGFLPYEGAQIGFADFWVSGSLYDHRSTPKVAATLSVSLMVGTIEAGTTTVNGVEWMANPITVLGPISVTIDADRADVRSGFPLPIPNDPGLEGGSISFQFVGVTPQNHFVLSDVFGTYFKGASQAMAFGGTLVSNGGGGNSKPDQALRDWLAGGTLSSPVYGQREL